jgi:hypothetical protein
MNREEAVLNAAFVLGRASIQLFNDGYRSLGEDCTKAADALKASVAESRELDVFGDGFNVDRGSANKLVAALTNLVTRYTVMKI